MENDTRERTDTHVKINFDMLSNEKRFAGFSFEKALALLRA